MLDPASPTVHGCGLSEYRFRQPHVLTALRFQGPEEGEGEAWDAIEDVGFEHFFGCGLYVYGAIAKGEERLLEGLWNFILWA